MFGEATDRGGISKKPPSARQPRRHTHATGGSTESQAASGQLTRSHSIRVSGAADDPIVRGREIYQEKLFYGGRSSPKRNGPQRVRHEAGIPSRRHVLGIHYDAVSVVQALTRGPDNPVSPEWDDPRRATANARTTRARRTASPAVYRLHPEPHDRRPGLVVPAQDRGDRRTGDEVLEHDLPDGGCDHPRLHHRRRGRRTTGVVAWDP